MKKIITSVGFLMLFGPAVATKTNGPVVPAAVKDEIIADLKKRQECQGEYVQLSVDGVKVAPRKTGFIGSCRYGGGVSVLYGQTPKGIKKLFQIEVGMNGGFSVGRRVFNGYYELEHYERSGPSDVFGETYRWNGSRYVLHSK